MGGRYPPDLGSAATASNWLQHPARTNHRHAHPLVSMIALVQNHRLRPKLNMMSPQTNSQAGRHSQMNARN